uniref:HAT C-terminal dimerisation domain-containing protein n=1 Tax=Anopheles epiroticus TaxID=199890 RepID=A0A182PP05_9DIPT
MEESVLQQHEDPLGEASQANNTAEDGISALGTLGLASCTSLDGYIAQSITEEKRQELDMMLVDFICDEFLPVSVVESAKLQTLVNNLNSYYVLPSRKTVSTTLLPYAYEEKLKIVKSELLSTKSVALTSDGWSNNTGTKFLTLSAHFIDENFKLSSRLLECTDISPDFSEESIAQWFFKILKKFGIESKVELIVTANTTMGRVIDDYTNIKRLPCFATSLNFVMQESIAKTIKKTVDKVKRVVQHFKTNPKALQLLLQLQSQENVKLKQDVSTQWNTTYDMLERFHQNKQSLQSYFELFKPETTLRTDEWEVVEQAIDVLKAFHKATDFISAERSVTISHVGVLRKMLLEHLAKFTDRDGVVAVVRTLIAELQEGLTNSLEPFKQNCVVAQAMLLDPRIKKRGFRNELQEYQQAYEAIISDLIAIQGTSVQAEKAARKKDTKSDNIYSEFLDWDDDEEDDDLNNPRQLAVHEFEMYLKERIIQTDENPLLWWKTQHLKYPTVYNLAVRILNVPCSSIPCERVFSKEGEEYLQKRARLLPQQCEKIMFVQSNA